mgnify:CR=1 FL=1
MIDIKWIRDNPTALDSALKRRHAEPKSEKILDLDTTRRTLMTDMQALQSRRNEISREIGQIKAKGGDAPELMSEMQELGPKLKDVEEKVRGLDEDLQDILSSLPNIPAEDVPEGLDDTQNEEIHKWGKIKDIQNPKAHYELGEALGLMNFERAAKMAGSRFVWLEGQLARLERALMNFFLDSQTMQNGYTEASTPFMANAKTLYGTGQLPKFEDDQFKTEDGYYMIPTSEVTLTNSVQGDILPAEVLPIKYTAATPCFRREAGSAGKDTRGMIRVHQFTKVEMVQIVHPDKSEEAHQEMVRCAEDLLQKLEIPYRVVKLCTGDLGFGARKTYDIEAWIPSQNTYREVSSVSNCGDFQARRMNTRFRTGPKQTEFVHTLNGSGLPTGRTMVALLENHQQADGTIRIPEVLQPYMGGLAFIGEPAEKAEAKAV